MLTRELVIHKSRGKHVCCYYQYRNHFFVSENLGKAANFASQVKQTKCYGMELFSRRR